MSPTTAVKWPVHYILHPCARCVLLHNFKQYQSICTHRGKMAQLHYILHPCRSSVVIHTLSGWGSIYTHRSKMVCALYFGWWYSSQFIVWNSILASCRNMPVGYSKYCVVLWICKEPPVPGFSKNQNQRTGWFRVFFKNQNQSTSQFRIFQNPQGPDSFQEKTDGSFPVFPRFFDFETSFLGQLWGRVTHKYYLLVGFWWYVPEN